MSLFNEGKFRIFYCDFYQDLTVNLQVPYRFVPQNPQGGFERPEKHLEKDIFLTNVLGPSVFDDGDLG